MKSSSAPWAFATAFLATVVVMTLVAVLLPAPSYKIRVAFVGNSMQFVNDLPRFMQAIAKESPTGESRIYQNSCLHGSLNFKSLLRKGNGMYHKWRTRNAKITKGIYDYGACTVPQLLLGYDENLQALNANGYYKKDGRNPCLQSSKYYEYLVDTYDNTTTTQWDFVVLNDQSKRPAISSKAAASMKVLQKYYVPMLLETGAIPVLLATHGYQSTQFNVSRMGNISEFTSNVYAGYHQYAALLEESLPEEQKPRIAPVGLAFLVVYEENIKMWKKLFFVDGLHPSPHGTYLMGCVLYATFYGRMPHPMIAMPPLPQQLWWRARKMQIGSKYHMPYPSYDEAVYLYHVAQRVMMQHHRPHTWTPPSTSDGQDYSIISS